MKITIHRGYPRVIESTHFRNFDRTKFREDRILNPWETIGNYNDPNSAWQT